MITARKLAIPILAVIALAITACGGGGSGTTPPAHDAGGKGALTFKLTVPKAPANASPGVRKRFAFSASTSGLVIQAWTSPYTGTGSPVATGTFDVSVTSANCVTNADTSRTCTVTLPLRAGSYDLKVVNYDMAPVSGSIPAGAHQLGYGFVASQTIMPGASNTVSLTVAGIPCSVHITLPVPAVRALESSTQYASVTALDAAGSVILGTYVDTAGNAATVSMSESTSTGLVSFSPSSFTFSQSGGVAITYSPAALTLAQMTSGPVIGITATVSGGVPGNATLSVPNAAKVITPAAFSTGAPSGVANGPDGNVWVALGSGDDIGYVNTVTLSGSTVSLQSTGLAPTPGPRRIVAGPDGNMWSTAFNGSGVALIPIPGHSPATYFTPTFLSKPSGIASDGTNLWITENALDKVAKVTTGGVITEYGTGISATANLSDIALGADGRMWFAEPGVDKVGAINTSTTTVTEYSASPVVGIDSICTGPTASNVWITDSGAGEIASVSTGGVVTGYPVSGATGVLYCTLGPDGNVWFVATTSSGYAIGRVNLPATTLELFPLPASNPTGMAVGPDDNIWIADSTARGLIRVQP